MIERLELRNLAVFTDLMLDLSPKINVIIGENGTGKTHLLKTSYHVVNMDKWNENFPKWPVTRIAAAGGA